MYITINNTDYGELRNLSFVPEIDAIGDSLPVNEFSVEIKTEGGISIGQYAYLYDDLDQLWAKFWIVFAEEVDEGFVQVRAQSPIGLLDRYPLPAVIYTSATTIQTALNTVFNKLSGIATYTLDPNLVSKSVKGYCPEQTARERLQWILYVTGAYAKQAFTDTIEILEIDINTDEDDVTEIALTETYWKPELQFNDYVTAINLYTYSFTAGTPVSGDEYVTVNDVNYIITKTLTQLVNTNVPQTAAPNEIEIEGLYLANSDNASDILSRLALIYFARKEVNADIINNRKFFPAEKVEISLDDNNPTERKAIGYIQSEDFAFGLQAKSAVKIIVMTVKELTKLIVNYIYSGVVIAKRRYSFPVGTHYQIQNDFIEQKKAYHQYVYRPLNEYAEGDIAAGTNVNNQNVAIALHAYWDGVTSIPTHADVYLLQIKSVSEIEYDSERKVLEIG